MTEAYTVKGEYLFITDAPKILAEIASGFERAIGLGNRFRTTLREIGEQEGSLRRLSRSLKEIDSSSLASLSGEARSAALSFDGITSAISAAREQMRGLIAEAGRLSSVRVGRLDEAAMGGGGAGRGGSDHGGGFRKAIGADIPGYHSPGLKTILGGTALCEGAKSSFNAYAGVQQVYDTLLSDSRVRTDPAVMKAITGSADQNLERYKVLTPMDAARNASEGYALSGSELREQGAITDMLGRVEQSMILRGKSGEDAPREASGLVFTEHFPGLFIRN